MVCPLCVGKGTGLSSTDTVTSIEHFGGGQNLDPFFLSFRVKFCIIVLASLGLLDLKVFHDSACVTVNLLDF